MKIKESKLGKLCNAAGCSRPARSNGRKCNSCAQLMSRYGLTRKDLDDLLTLQGPACYICKKVAHLDVDYDNDMHKVLGLVCKTCSSVNGQLRKFKEMGLTVSDG